MDWPKSAKEAGEHIEAIRQARNISDNRSDRTNAAELGRALNIIGEQLYQESTHFLLEMIQNADDNTYSDSLTPSLHFKLDKSSLQIQSNEMGFQRRHVDAICSIAASTKSGLNRAKEFVGEKGIGFKSVFKVATVVSIASGHYSFKFDKRQPLGMITPIWSPYPVKRENPKYSAFHLCLADDCDRKALVSGLKNLDFRSLLFLRRLRQIRIEISEFGAEDCDLLYTREDQPDQVKEPFSFTTLRRNEQLFSFVVHKSTVLHKAKEDKRPGATTSQISIAFPIKDGLPSVETQKVYAFLPIRDYGFKFLIHADFLLTANREDIIGSSTWNFEILSQLHYSIVQALEHFATRELGPADLRYTWLRFGPAEEDVSYLFWSVARRIQKALRSCLILQSASGGLARPQKLSYVPPEFRDDENAPLTISSSNGHSYVSGSYADADKALILSLGAQEMTPSRFLQDLAQKMRDDTSIFKSAPKKYHIKLARELLRLHGDPTLSEAVAKLPIIRIRGGAWVAADEHTVFFPGTHTERTIPEGVEALIVQTQFAKIHEIRTLYIALGVTQLDDQGLCNLVVRTHKSPRFHPKNLSLETLVSHVLLLFELNYQNEEGTNLWVSTEDNRHVRASQVYQTVPINHSAKKYLQNLTLECYYLHPTYLLAVAPEQRQQFSRWLFMKMDVWRCPRMTRSLDDGGFEISFEFHWMLENVPSAQWLTLLRDCWPVYSKWFEELGDENANTSSHDWSVKRLRQVISFANVQCLNQQDSPLFQTFLPFSEWTDSKFALPLLDVAQPEHPNWNFLRLFGVGVQRDIQFYLYCLNKLAVEKPEDPGTYDQVCTLYAEIQDAVGKESGRLKAEFESKKLVYVPQSKSKIELKSQWIELDRCTWNGPQLRQFTSLAEIYPKHTRLFKDLLELEDLEIDHIIHEMKQFRPAEDLGYVNYIFDFLNDAVKTSEAAARSAMRVLKEFATFPIIRAGSPKNQKGYDFLSNTAATSTWFIGDLDDLAQSFDGLVDLLAYDVDTNQKFKLLYKSLNLEDRFLSASVAQDPDIVGTPVFHPKYTSFLQSRLSFILRLVPETCKDRKKISTQLRGLKVYGVEAILQRSSVTFKGKKTSGSPTPGVSALLQNPECLEIYLLSKDLKSAYHEFQYDLADQLSDHCDVDSELKSLLLLVILERNNKVISREFQKKGVRNLTNDEEKDQSSFFKKLSLSSEDGTESNPSELKLIAEGTTLPRKVKVYSSRQRKVAKVLKSTKSKSTDSASSNRFSVLSDFGDDLESETGTLELYVNNESPQSSDVDTTDDENDSDTGVPGRVVVLHKGSKKLRRKKRQPVIGIDEDLTCTAEHCVSQDFTLLMPDFYNPEYHWTSPRREKAGHPAISQFDSNGCDSSFIISDAAGTLTRFLIGNGLSECISWERSPPTYHIEVLGSKGGQQEAVLMSRDWWALARKYALKQRGENTNPPEHVCMLIRVSNLGINEPEPEMNYILDPWHWFMNNDLKVEADNAYRVRVRSRLL